MTDKFWNEFMQSTDEYVVEIDHIALLDFLNSKGFYKFYAGSKIFLLIKDKVVNEIHFEKIKDFILEYVRNKTISLSDKVSNKKIEWELINKANSFLSLNFFSLLPVAKLKFIHDEKGKSYFPFNNCIVEVTKSGIRNINYSETDFCIWKDQVINKKFDQIEQTSDFEKFISNICKNDQSRINSLKSSVGYLLSNHKDPTVTKAIVFYDEKDSKNKSLEGRTGKSLVAKGISQLRNTLTVDGKNFNMKDKFIFQQVNLSTQVINLNDVLNNFNFESFFSIVTEGIKIEKKNRDSFSIPYEESPKLLISTNHTLLGKGGSYKDRMFEIEFSDFYNDQHKPINDFGKRFFNDWDDVEWNSFYCFMFGCLKFYLTHGLVDYKTININQRKMKQELGTEFVDFADNIEIGRKHDKQLLFKKFQIDSEVNVGYSQRTFTENLRIYSHYKNLDMVETKSANRNYFRFILKTK